MLLYQLIVSFLLSLSRLLSPAQALLSTRTSIHPSASHESQVRLSLVDLISSPTELNGEGGVKAVPGLSVLRMTMMLFLFLFRLFSGWGTLQPEVTLIVPGSYVRHTRVGSYEQQLVRSTFTGIL
jgi:hypothetical protein